MKSILSDKPERVMSHPPKPTGNYVPARRRFRQGLALLAIFGALAFGALVAFGDEPKGKSVEKKTVVVKPVAVEDVVELMSADTLAKLREKAADKYLRVAIIRRPGWVTSRYPEWLAIEDIKTSQVAVFEIPTGQRSALSHYREGQEIELPKSYVLWESVDDFQLSSLTKTPTKVMRDDATHYVVNGFALR